MLRQLSRLRQLNLLLAVAIMFSLFIPAISQANPLSKIDLNKTANTVRPWVKLVGNIGGAIAGAALCSAVVPPLGFLVGGVAGWMAGGMLANFATKSPGNLAVVTGGALGVIALASLGPVGYVVGGLIGAGLGKLAVNLINKAREETFGNRAQPVQTDSGTSNNTGQTALFSVAPTSSSQTRAVSASSSEIRQAEQDYQSAYKAYIDASNEGKDISAAHKLYQKALETYRRLTGKNP